MPSSSSMCLCLNFQQQKRLSIERACSELVVHAVNQAQENLHLASHVRGGSTNLCLRCGKPGATRLCSGCGIARFCGHECERAAASSHSGDPSFHAQVCVFLMSRVRPCQRVLCE